MKNLFILALFSLSCIALHAQINLDSGLVAYWELNGSTIDSTPNANHGTIYGATLTTDRHGQANSAYAFDGVNDYIKIISYSQMSPTTAVTVSAWIKTAVATGSPAIYDRIETNDGYGLKLNASGYLRMTINGGLGQAISNQMVTTNQWMHVVGVYEQSNSEIRLYINGELVGTGTYSSPISYSPEPRNAIGSQQLPGNPNYFNGSIDEVRVYNRVLNSAEINELYTPTSGTAIENHSSSYFHMYPNPVTQGTLNLQFQNKAQRTIRILDICGKTQLLKTTRQTNVSLWVKELNKGCYILRIEEEGNTLVRKVLIP